MRCLLTLTMFEIKYFYFRFLKRLSYIYCGTVQGLRLTRAIMDFVDVDGVAAGILRIRLKCQKLNNK